MKILNHVPTQKFAVRTTKKELGCLMLLKNTKGFYCSLMINHLQTKVKTNVGLNFSIQHHFFINEKSTKYYAKKINMLYSCRRHYQWFLVGFPSNLWGLKKGRMKNKWLWTLSYYMFLNFLWTYVQGTPGKLTQEQVLEELGVKIETKGKKN